MAPPAVLTGLDERLPETIAVARALGPVVDQILPAGWTVTEIGYRCPGPGTGGQQLHADDRPRLDPDPRTTGATAIVALVLSQSVVEEANIRCRGCAPHDRPLGFEVNGGLRRGR